MRELPPAFSDALEAVRRRKGISVEERPATPAVTLPDAVPGPDGPIAVDPPDKPGTFLPTPEVIRAMCALIRLGWSPAETDRRARGQSPEGRDWQPRRRFTVATGTMSVATG
ncbi:MAG: hypothetical protein SH850_08070 [Planctomycetaceae bacterium]|nr:hypothetical protein [Planctomycetaceae bacterium]